MTIDLIPIFKPPDSKKWDPFWNKRKEIFGSWNQDKK